MSAVMKSHNFNQNPYKVMREVKVVEFCETFRKWKAYKTPCRVRDVKTNEIFDVFESELKIFQRNNELMVFVVKERT